MRQEHRFRTSRPIALLALLLIVVPMATGQESGDDSLTVLNDTLEKRKADAERMERMIDALNQVDSLYKLRYPAWVVLDDDVSERIRRAFRTRKIEYPPGAEIQVVVNPPAGEILEISIGTARMGRNDTRSFLADSLHATIIAGEYNKRMVDARPKDRRVGQLYGAHPRFAAAHGSAFGAGILLSNGWGAEATMGFEELGYHFWSTGSVRGLAVFDQFKIGVVIPIAIGTESTDTQPLDIRPRKMTGALGFATELRFPWEENAIDLLLSVADVPRVTNFRLLTDSVSFYFLHTVSQASYSRQFDLGKANLLTLTGGVGYHQMARGVVQADRSVVTADKEDFLSPIVRIEYVNRASNMFGVSAQIYSSVVHLKGWVEIVRNLFYIDLQYYSALFRDPKPWEQPYFFMISPRIQVVY
ncbi:MAG: hypothetical protein OEV30_07930 [Ignavibacteria bacterium]|nr:hypothetical protein [Ignavibacteria bacterium]